MSTPTEKPITRFLNALRTKGCEPKRNGEGANEAEEGKP